jgi:hypothetical protein
MGKFFFIFGFCRIFQRNVRKQVDQSFTQGMARSEPLQRRTPCPAPDSVLLDCG